jgi:hypothetical protein
MNVTNMNYQILQTLLDLIFLLQTAGSDPALSLVGKSMSFFLPLSTYTLKILGLGEGMCGGPNLLVPAGSTVVQYTF